MTHKGRISLLSSLTVLCAFLARYSSSCHKPTSLKNLQNNLYSLCRFSQFAGWGSLDPIKKSGGDAMTHGAHRQNRQWFTARSIGTVLERWYPRGWCKFNMGSLAPSLLSSVWSVSLWLVCWITGDSLSQWIEKWWFGCWLATWFIWETKFSGRFPVYSIRICVKLLNYNFVEIFVCEWFCCMV